MDLTRLDISQIENRLREINLKLGRRNNSRLQELKEDLLFQKSRIELKDYGDNLRPAHKEFLNVLGNIVRSGDSDDLCRRSYQGALYNIFYTQLLSKKEFQHLKPYFPLLKLPLKLEKNDLTEFKSLLIDDRISVKDFCTYFVKSFCPEKFTRPGDHMRTMLWAPILKVLVDFVFSKSDFEFHPVSELNTNVIGSFPWTRFVDFAVLTKGPKRLPYILVEMAEGESGLGEVHKDFRKISVVMIHVLNELVKRAETSCPDENINDLRVYGLLIGGSIFELCVATVCKARNGKISYIFHSNDRHWKFDLNGELIATPETDTGLNAEDLVCEGDRSILGNFVELATNSDVPNPFADGKIIAEDELEDYLEDEGEWENLLETELSKFDRIFIEPVEEGLDKSLIILIKYFKEMAAYFDNLPECLKECYQRAPETFSVEALKHQFPSALPKLERSATRHSKKSPEVIFQFEQIVEPIFGEEMESFYSWKGKFPTLPDVVYYDRDSRLATLRKPCFKLRKLSQLGDHGRRFNYIAAHACKLILDLTSAVHKIYSMGLVCGCIQPEYVGNNHLFWYFWFLPNFSKESESSIGTEDVPGFDPRYHLTSSPMRLSHRDDLYGIIKSFYKLFPASREIIKNRKKYPLFDKFLQLSLDKILHMELDADITAKGIILECLPIYEKMVEDLSKGPSRKYALVSTLKLMKEIVQHSEQSSSVEMVAIHEKDFAT